jgi:CheY-like chemotaxis protein
MPRPESKKPAVTARAARFPTTAHPSASLQPAVTVRRLDYSLLITDDDDAFRETLRNIFEPEGFQTLLAHSGEEALEILRSHPVHIALLDQHLPRLTGLETLRIIRQRNAILPVILMTAESTQQLMRDALSAHAFCVMSKPVTRSVVVYTVQQALSRSYDSSSNIVGGERDEATL